VSPYVHRLVSLHLQRLAHGHAAAGFFTGNGGRVSGRYEARSEGAGLEVGAGGQQCERGSEGQV